MQKTFGVLALKHLCTLMIIIFHTESETPRMKEDPDCPESAIQLVPFGLSLIIQGL